MKIAFFKETTLFGKLVTFFTRGRYSHCSIILNNGQVIESKPFKGVRLLPNLSQSVKNGCQVDIYETDLSHQQTQTIELFLKNQIGKKYDYWSVFAFVFLGNKPRKKDSKKWFCSEIIFAAFEYAHAPLLERVPAWKVAPTMLSYSPKIRLVQKMCI